MSEREYKEDERESEYHRQADMDDSALVEAFSSNAEEVSQPLSLDDLREEELDRAHRKAHIGPENFRKNWQYKYLRFADNNVKFGDATCLNSTHKCIALQYAADGNDAPPVFAGQIKVRGKQWCIAEGGSTILKLQRGNSDEKYIDKVLSGYGFKHDPEMMYK